MSAALDVFQRIRTDHPYGVTRRFIGKDYPDLRGLDLKVMDWRTSRAKPEVLVVFPPDPTKDRWVHEEDLLPREGNRVLTGAEALANVGWANGSQPAPAAVSDTSEAMPRATGYVDDNPKTAAGALKPPMGAVPGPALLALGMVMEGGKAKYGMTNWREFPVTVSTYTNAAQRHMLEFLDGETFDRESGIIQLAHVMACCAIVIDAMAQGTITDDRTKFPGQTSDLIKAISEGKPNAICNPR